MSARTRDPNESKKADRQDRLNNIAKGVSVDKNGVKRRPRAPHTDWDLLEKAFINDYEKELVEFCFEFTGNIDDPKYKTAETKCRQGKWKDLKRIQMASDPEYMAKLNLELKSFDYTTAETVRDSRLQLVDANKTIQKHLEVAQELNQIVRFHTPRILEASEFIDWRMLAEDDPKAFFSAVKDVSAILDISIKIERTSLDLANVKIELVKTEPDKPTVDYSKMSDAELSALYSDTIRTIDINNA